MTKYRLKACLNLKDRNKDMFLYMPQVKLLNIWWNLRLTPKPLTKALKIIGEKRT